MTQIKKAAIVCCSNGQDVKYKEKTEQLQQTLSSLGIETVLSPYIYANENGFCGTAAQRAESLMNFYKDSSIDAIFDISGGDLANELLPLLDYELIQNSNKMFWGYSDLTTIINAIYAKTGQTSVLYQVRNLLKNHAGVQYDFEYSFVQGKEMSGVVVGGNIRCLLKLAGTPYWPDMKDKILLLESFSGNVARITTYFSQLKQMGVFEQVKGVLLGTFTEMEREGYTPGIEEIVLQHVNSETTVAVTKQIGHGADSKAILIGAQLKIKDN